MTPGKPQLLMLCQTLPFPPDGGVHIRTYNIMRLLARDFDVTALCFYRVAERASSERVRQSLEGLRRLAAVEAFPIPQEHSKARLVADHIVSVLSGRAYTIRTYESSEFRARILELLREKQFSLVHMDSLDLAGYLPILRGLPTICAHHNVESELLRRRGETTRGPLGRYMKLQARLTEREEKRWCVAVDLNVTVSELDRIALEKIAPGAKFVVVPNGVNTEEFQPAAVPKSGMVFVGGYSWQPNRDAMDHFCLDILPLIRAGGEDAKVTWVGRASDAVRRDYEKKFGIRLCGYVDDVRPIVQSAACYIAPLRAGGGTRLKILDAWAMGKAVVSTTVGCEGLDARDGENILIRDTPVDFADGVRTILSDDALRDRLGAVARRTAETIYDWEVVGKSMLEHYRHVTSTTS